MSNDSSPIARIKSGFSRFGHFLFSHNRMIYFVLFFLAISGAVLGLNLALGQPTDQTYYDTKLSETQSPRFDKDTIDKIQNLNAKQQTITNPPPAGQRTNPFGE